MKISVVIPTYNNAPFIGKAIESCLRQTIKPHEIIVVDDGSTDDTHSVLKGCEPGVRVLRQENAGAGPARNAGVACASGEWIAFLDSDDCWNQDHLESLISAQAGYPETALVYSGKQWVDVKGTPIPGIGKQDFFPEGWIFGVFFEANVITSTSCALVRRDLFQRLGGFTRDPVYRVCEDFELWLRIAARNPIAAFPRPTVQYRRHSNNMTLRTASVMKGRLAALRRAADMIRRGEIDPRNQPQNIDVRRHLRRAYLQTVESLFFVRQYSCVRKVAIQALRDGCATIPICLRATVTLAPSVVINFGRQLRRTSIATGNNRKSVYQVLHVGAVVLTTLPG